MGGVRGSQRLVTVTAKCGHKVNALVYPGLRIGTAGQRNIAKAQANICYYCKQFPGQKFIGFIETEMGEATYSSNGTYEAYEALGDKSRSGDWETVRRWIERQLDSIEESNASNEDA